MVLGKFSKLPKAVSSSAKWENTSAPLVGVLKRFSQYILKGSMELGPSTESAEHRVSPQHRGAVTAVHQHELFACRNPSGLPGSFPAKRRRELKIQPPPQF